jgi:hypothetical protein
MNLGAAGPTTFDTTTSNTFVEAWVYFNALAGNSRIYGHYFNPTNNGDYNIRVSGSSLGFTNGSVVVSHQTAMQTGVWTHIAFSLMTNGTANVFVNGVVNSTGGPITVGYTSTHLTLIGGGSGSITNAYIRDLRVVQGGVVPVATFTPGAAPFSYALPSYVTGSGTTVFTLLGQFITYVPGKYGSAVSIQNFMGASSGNKQIIYNTDSFNQNSTTISLWVNTRSLNSSGAPAYFIFCTASTAGYIAVSLGSSNALTITNMNTSGQIRSVSTTSNYVQLNTWYHVTSVSVQSNITLYINGLLISSGNLENDVIINRINIGANTNRPFDGLIDDLRIYNTALTSTQVQSVYSSQGAPAPSRAMPLPKLAWDFNGTTTPYIGTVSSTTVTGAVAYGSGKYGQDVIIRNPINGGFANVITYNLSTSIPVDAGVTFTLWVKYLALPASTFGTTTFVISGTNVAIYLGARGPNIWIIGGFLNGSFYDSASVNQTLTTDMWYHMGLTVGFGQISMYFNGVLRKTSAYTLPVANSLTIARVGADNGYAGDNVELDDLRIFDRALTSAQVQSIYNQQGVPGRGVQTLTAPLDSLSPSGVYSTRLLRSAYNGPMINVRRTSDDAMLDFVGDKFGNLSNTQSAVTIDTWLTSTTGNVTTWYDQAYSNNFIQVNTINQPQIVKNGGKWVLFFNRDATPTFYSNMYMTTNQTGIYSIMYNCNVSSTYNSNQTLLGSQFNDNRGFRFNNNLLYGDATQSGGRYGQDFLAAAGSYWYLNNQYGNMSIGAAGVASVVNPTRNNGVYTNGVWNYIIGVANGGMDSFQFNSISSPQLSIKGRAMYGYLSELVMFKTQLSDSQARSLYATQYISRGFITMTGTSLFTQLSQAATSSAVGAFSLRAVNGTSARVVAVQAHPVVQWPPIAMTSNNFTATGTYNGIVNGVYTASDLSGGVVTTVFRLFDNDINTNYEQYYTGANYYDYNLGTLIDTTKTTTVSGETAAGWWVQLQLPTAIILRSYTLIGRQNGGLWNTRNPTTFWIAGSTNGTTWSNVHFQSGISYGQSGTTITVPQTSNSLPYSYYRLIVNVIGNPGAAGNHSTLDFATWNLFGDAPSYAPNAAQDFYADRLGNLLTAPVVGQPLANWLGGATGYVTTWYDQSGRGNHAIQNTAAKQPVIQRATKGTGYMVVFNGVNGTTNFGLNFGAYNLLNNTSYSTCAVVRRTAPGDDTVGANANYYLSGSGGANSQDQYFHSGYRISTQLTLAHYSDDMGVTIPAFTTASTEPINYNFMTLGTDKVGRIYSYSGGTLYPTPTTTRTYVGFLNHPVGASLSIGGGFRQFTGEIYELLVFTKSLYDLDGTTSITQVYQNQLGYTGA